MQIFKQLSLKLCTCEAYKLFFGSNLTFGLLNSHKFKNHPCRLRPPICCSDSSELSYHAFHWMNQSEMEILKPMIMSLVILTFMVGIL